MKRIIDFLWRAYFYLLESMDLAKSMYYHDCILCNKKKVFIPIPGIKKEERMHVCQGCIKKQCFKFNCDVCKKDYFTNNENIYAFKVCIYCLEKSHYEELSNPQELKGMLQDFNNAF